MSALLSAVSPGALVEQIGSYAGYASILGLGIMSLLYFAQAREVRRLREWAGRAPERAQELEQRVQEDAQRRVVAQPMAPASPAAQQAAEARTAAATAAVYASIGAPPPGAKPPPPGQLARPATAPAGAPAAGAPAAGAPAAGAPAAGAPAAGAPAAGPAAGAPGAPGAVPAPPAAQSPAGPTPAASAGTQTPAPPQPSPAPAARPAVTATPAPQATTAAAAARVAAASRPIPLPSENGYAGQDTAESAAARPERPLARQQQPIYDDGDEGYSPGRIGMIVGGAIATVLVAVVLVVALTGGDTAPPPPNDFGNTPATEKPADTPKSGDSGASSSGLTSAERRATSVAVLNGTTQTGLARNVGDKIEKADFTIGSVTNNADQSVPATIVSYTPGSEKAALEVAKIIGVDRGSVQPADANTTTAADAAVVVTVGSDQIE